MLVCCKIHHCLAEKRNSMLILSIFHGFCNVQVLMGQFISVPEIHYLYKMLSHMERKIQKMHRFFDFSDSAITTVACNSFQPKDHNTGFKLLIFQLIYAKQFTVKAKGSSTLPSTVLLLQDSFSLQIICSGFWH